MAVWSVGIRSFVAVEVPPIPKAFEVEGEDMPPISPRNLCNDDLHKIAEAWTRNLWEAARGPLFSDGPIPRKGDDVG